MPRNSLVYGALILFIANLVNRSLGFVYQYLIMHYIGSEAYGLFHMVFPVYMTALVLATAGIPLAISKMVSEKISLGHYSDAQKTFRIAFVTLFLSGLFVSLILFLNSSFIMDRFFADQRVLIVFQICIPSIFFVSIASAFRGYFQGLQNMIPSAISQVSEQIFRVIVGFTLSFKLLSKGIEWAAVGLAVGMLCGEILGLAVILIQYLLRKNRINSGNHRNQTTKSILWSLLTLSFPVTGSRLMSSGLSTLDAVIIPRQLQIAGYTARSATSLFGQLSGTALTLLTFPSVFTFALSTSLVPAISEAITRKNYKLAQSRCSDAIRYTIILGLPCVITLYFFAEPLTLLFKSEEVFPILKVLAIGGLFAYLQQTTTGILQGMGKTFLPLLHTSISAIFRIPLLFFLTGIPKWGLLGSSWAYVFGFFCIAILNIRSIQRNIGMKIDLKSFFFQPFSAGLGMLATVKGITMFIPNTLVTCFFSIVFGLSIYLSILNINGGFSLRDLRKIPFFNRFIS